MTKTNTSAPVSDDPELQRILEELLANDEDITARAVARRHPALKAASSFTRSPARSDLLARYQQRQAEFRRWQRRLPHRVSAKIVATLAEKDLRITALESQVELLTTSHLAMIKAVGELGGFSKWAVFYENYAAARDQLKVLGALPLAGITPLSPNSASSEMPPLTD